MHAKDWIKNPVESILDLGCNVGAWLADCRRLYPSAKLAGIEINNSAIEIARTHLPTIEFHEAGVERIPFSDGSFQYVTCIEVLEHLPADLRHVAFREIMRVLKPGGRVILTVPHAGSFAWLDSNNVRLRVPRLYGRLVGRGRRDATYAALSRHVEWHHHFTEEELLGLAGDGWERVAVTRGGLFLYPLMDWLSWPFYRLGVPHHPIRRLFEQIGGWDYRLNLGRASYGILVVLQRTENTDGLAVKGGTSSTVGEDSIWPDAAPVARFGRETTYE